jgi:hypothetical protein
MSLPLTLTRVALRPERALDLRDGAGTAVTAVEGVLWITETGEAGDVLLEPGQSHVVSRNGLTLVSALGGAAVALLVPARPSGITAAF